MGSCLAKRTLELSEITEYSSTIALKIKDKDITGELMGFDDIVVKLTKPQRNQSLSFSLQDCVVQAASCVLPGLDPRGTSSKDCQDNLCVRLSKGLLLAALFDGHGSFGRQIVEACATFISKQFDQEIDQFIKDPKVALQKLVEDCDIHASERSGIDASLSGSTSVILLVTPFQIFSANLGDSRGVLGCVPSPTDDLRNAIDQHRSQFKRLVIPGRILLPLEMTYDLKPNLQDEIKRIQQAGGVVQKITDASGRKLGPYRVWKPGTTLPGLAMSRSLGDTLAKSIGVIATPVIQQFSLNFDRDLFAVIASDGVWDVFTNQEVINFIERFRKHARRNFEGEVRGPVAAKTTNIAHLLCEEARFRWLGLVQEEDVIIDDISCVVLEFASLQPFTLKRVEREETPMSVVDMSISGLSYEEEIITKTSKRKDPMRSSIL